MPTTEVNLPDGSSISVNHPENATELDILKYAKLHHTSTLREEVSPAVSSAVTEDTPRPTMGSGFGQGLSRGVDVVQRGYSSALEGLGKFTGWEGLEEAGAEIAEEQERQLAEKAQFATRRQDVEDLRSGARFFTETLGELVPTLATTMAGFGTGAAIGSAFPVIGTAIGGIAGGIAVNIPFFYGLNREAQKDAVEKGIKMEVNEGTAFLSALPQAALDVIADRFLLGFAGKGVLGAENFIRTGNILTRGVKGIAAGTILEVPTEVGQQIIERAQANEDITSEEALNEYVDVAVAAGILGGTARGASSIVKGDVRKQDYVVEEWDTKDFQKQEGPLWDDRPSDILDEVAADETAQLLPVTDEVVPEVVKKDSEATRISKAIDEGKAKIHASEWTNAPKLPANLAIDPTYKKYNVKFANDVDKALFIVSDPSITSERRKEYISFLRTVFPRKSGQDFTRMGFEYRKTLDGLLRNGMVDSDQALAPHAFTRLSYAVLDPDAPETIVTPTTANEDLTATLRDIAQEKYGEDVGSVQAANNDQGVIPSILARREAGLPSDNFFTYENPYTKGDKIIYHVQDRLIGLKRIEEAIDQNRKDTISELNADRKTKGLDPLSPAEIRSLRLAPITAEESAYIGEERMPGIIGNLIKTFENNELKPLTFKINAINKKFSDIRIPEVEEFLILRHAIERNKKVRFQEPDNDAGAGEIQYENGDKRRLTDDYVKERMASQYDVKWDEKNNVWTGGNEKAKYLQDIAKDVDAIVKTSMDVRVQNGLLSDKDAKRISNTFKYYVPLKGHKNFEDDYSGVFRSSSGEGQASGFTVVGPEGKRIKTGRTTEANTPLGTIIGDRANAIERGVKNKSFSERLFNLAKENPSNNVWKIITNKDGEYEDAFASNYTYAGDNPDFRGMEISKDQYKTVENPDEWFQKIHTKRHKSKDPNRGQLIGAKLDGEQVYIEIADPRLRATLLNLNADNLNAVVRTLGTVNRFLSMVNTSLNPGFIVGNFAKDLQTAIWNVIGEQNMEGGKAQKKKLTAKILRDTPGSIRSFYRGIRGATRFNRDTNKWESRLTEKRQKDFDQYITSGSKADWFHSAPPAKRLTDFNVLASMSDGTFKGTARQRRKALLDFVEDLNSSVENGVRFAAFTTARDSFIEADKKQLAKETGKDLTFQQIQEIESSAIAKASSLAKNLTINFNRKGQQGALLNSLYLFFNASVQGTANFARGFIPGLGPSVSKVKWAAASSMMAFAYMLSKLNEASSDEDENGKTFYSNIPDYEKERNFIVMKTAFDPNADGSEYWKFPLPYGYNIFHVAGTVVQEMESGNRDTGEATSLLTSTLLGSFSPISIGGSAVGLATATVPSAFQPGVQLLANKNFWGSPIYPENFPAGVQYPASQLSFRTTPEGYKVISEFLNVLGGGNESEPGSLLGISTDISPDALKHLAQAVIGGAGATGIRSLGTFNKWMNREDIKARDIPFRRRLEGEVDNFKSQQNYYDRKEDIMRKVNQYDLLISQGRRAEAQKYRQKNILYFSMQNILKISERRLREDNERIKKLKNRSVLSPANAIAYQDMSLNIEERKDGTYNKFNLLFNEKEKNIK